MFTPSPQQTAVINWVTEGKGNAVVEAVAGAGKTTTLVEMVRRMHGSIFIGAYNKKMGDELAGRVAGMTSVKAGTFHSAGFSALRRALSGVQVDGKKVMHLAQQIVDGKTQFAGWEPAICQLVSMAKQTGVGALSGAPGWYDLIEKYDVMDRLAEDADPRDLVAFSAQVLAASNADTSIVDFDDMIYLPLVRNLRFWQNEWVLIDEAQDTNAVRRALARKMLSPNGRLVAVGDPRQAIFGFTGADGDSLDLIRKEFGAQTLRLSVTFRCPKAVVAAAREYVDHIEASPTAPDGEHLSIDYAEFAGAVRPGDAVLCRYNRHLVSTAFKLIRAGVPCKIEGRAIGEGLAALAGRWKVRTLEALRTRLETWSEREIAKAKAKDDDAKIERIEDQFETMMILVERATEKNITSVDGLKLMIKEMFDDVGDKARNLVVLSSVHRSKGLEWPRVFILGRRQFMPSPRAKQAWAKEQEINLVYVALTRAQQTLVDVEMPVEQKKPVASAA